MKRRNSPTVTSVRDIASAAIETHVARGPLGVGRVGLARRRAHAERAVRDHHHLRAAATAVEARR